MTTSHYIVTRVSRNQQRLTHRYLISDIRLSLQHVLGHYWNRKCATRTSSWSKVKWHISMVTYGMPTTYNTHQWHEHYMFVAWSYIILRHRQEVLRQHPSPEERLWQATPRFSSTEDHHSYIITMDQDVKLKMTCWHCIRWRTCPFPG